MYRVGKQVRHFEKVRRINHERIMEENQQMQDMPVKEQPEAPRTLRGLITEKILGSPGTETGETRVSYTSALLNGAGVGLFLGLLLGLAVSPVVSGMIGTLSSLLVVLLGLNDKYLSTTKGLRIGSFGLLAVAGVLLGMYIRTHDALSPSTVTLKQEYSKAGFNDDQALYYVSQRVFGDVPPGWFGTNPNQQTKQVAAINPHSSVLFSSEIDAGQCYMLKSAKKSWPKSEIINSFKRAGGTWEELAAGMQHGLPDQVYVDAMLVLRDSFCGLGNSGKFSLETTPALAQLTRDDPPEKFTAALRNAGDNWQPLIDNAEKNIAPEYQKTFYLSLIKIIQDEKNS